MKKLSPTASMKAYIDHPGARSFKAPEADAEAQDLRYYEKLITAELFKISSFFL